MSIYSEGRQEVSDRRQMVCECDTETASCVGVRAHPDELITLSVEDAFELGRLWTSARYGDDAPQQALQPTASSGS